MPANHNFLFIILFSLLLFFYSSLASISSKMDRMTLDADADADRDEAEAEDYNTYLNGQRHGKQLLKKRTKETFKFQASRPAIKTDHLTNEQKRANTAEYLNLRPKMYENEFGVAIPDFDEYVENIQKLTGKMEKKNK